MAINPDDLRIDPGYREHTTPDPRANDFEPVITPCDGCGFRPRCISEQLMCEQMDYYLDKGRIDETKGDVPNKVLYLRQFHNPRTK